MDDHLRDQRVVVRRDLAPGLDRGVDPHARPERRPEALDEARRRREAVRRILRVDPDLDRVAMPRSAARDGERLARGDPHLLADDIDPRDELGDRMLDLEAAVDLDEVRLALGAEQELERPRALVADRGARAGDRRLELLARLGRERGRRRLLDQLLVPPLDRALALAERQHVAVRVAEHLDLDVARRRDDLLQVQRAVAERRIGLGRRGRERLVERVARLDEPHALATAPGGRLEQHREADRGGGLADRLERRRAVGARHERDARRAHLALRDRLVAEPLHHVGRRPDEDEVVLGARPCERRVLGEEAVARVDGLAARRRRGRDDARDPQVALGGGGGPRQTASSASRTWSASRSAVE